MMTIARNSWHFYHVFYVTENTYNEIRNKLVANNQLWKQAMQDDDGQEILIFGITAFKAEKNENNHSG